MLNNYLLYQNIYFNLFIMKNNLKIFIIILQDRIGVNIKTSLLIFLSRIFAKFLIYPGFYIPN